jgi:hypothetical protein
MPVDTGKKLIGFLRQGDPNILYDVYMGLLPKGFAENKFRLSPKLALDVDGKKIEIPEFKVSEIV